MFVFRLHYGNVIRVDGAPDIVFKAEDYNTFVANAAVYEQMFPNKLFGCVKSTDATYALNEDNKIPDTGNKDLKVGVYFGVCKKS